MELRHPWRRACLLGCCLLLSLAGCSLLTLKSPERPLSPRDLNARVLTRELAAQFLVAVSRCADDIEASEHDPQVLDNTLRWEIGAVAESCRAATRMAPLMSLVDTWALAGQMQAFTAAGAPGGALFGAHQQAVQALSAGFADDAQALARQLLAPPELATYQAFVAQYVREHPLADLSFARASVLEAWIRQHGADTRLIDTLGTIPEALADASDRLEIYGETVPAQALRATQLALRQSGYSQGDVQVALRRLDERLERLSQVAEATPELVRGAQEEVRQSVREVLGRLEASSRVAAEALHAERTALFADLENERVAAVAALDTQRAALAADAARISAGVIRDAGAQLRELAAEVLLLLGVLAVVVLGLPFVAGYLVGRARHASGERSVR